LGHIQGDGAVEFLIAALRDATTTSDGGPRLLVRIGVPAVPVLVTALKNDDARLRENAWRRWCAWASRR